MRSRSAPDLRGRCQRCWVLLSHCVCAGLPRLAARTEIVVVRHAWESRKSTGTARIAALCLERCRVLELADDPADVEHELSLLKDAWFLFPGAAEPPREQPPARLIVLDGTWRQARRMLRRLPPLAHFPRLSLKAAVVRPRLRQPTTAEQRSTLEAIADALGVLESETLASALHAAHDQYVARVFEARGRKLTAGTQPPLE